MKKWLYISALSVVLLLSAVVGWTWFRDNRMPNFGDHALLYVRPGMKSDDIVRLISKQCTIRNRKSLTSVFKTKEVDKYIKPGFYRIAPRNSSVQVARMLNNGWQTPVKLTLSGSLRSKDALAAKVASQMMLDSASFRRALDDEELLSLYDVTPRTVFALFIPDTYEMYWSASVEDILQRQKQAYDAFWTTERLEKADRLGLTKMQVSILASIVKGETHNKEEMPRVAGVYLNRLKIGMMLQADPTVAWCFDYKPSRILKKHLAVDSPYNTYRHAGLPPGPINVPDKTYIDAVLNADFGTADGRPGRSGNLYFCANPDFSGTHVFAKTLSAHEKNARAFQSELDRRARAKRK